MANRGTNELGKFDPRSHFSTLPVTCALVATQKMIFQRVFFVSPHSKIPLYLYCQSLKWKITQFGCELLPSAKYNVNITTQWDTILKWFPFLPLPPRMLNSCVTLPIFQPMCLSLQIRFDFMPPNPLKWPQYSDKSRNKRAPITQSALMDFADRT